MPTRLIDSNNKGNKANNLKILLQNKYKILPGFVLNPETKLNKVKENFNIIKKTIPFPWILRSSSETEDNQISSYAGCFESYGNIRNIDIAIEQFAKIIEISDISKTMGCLTGETPKPPFVIVQPFIQFKYKGVYFSPDPYTSGKFRIEYGKNDEITKGSSGIKKPKKFENQLYLEGEKIKKIFHWENLDMEWGLKENGELVILQVRPYLPGKNEIPEEMKKEFWKLDIEHNPLPLSFLHRSIIDHINSYKKSSLHV